jgi:hypothetical protein
MIFFIYIPIKKIISETKVSTVAIIMASEYCTYLDLLGHHCRRKQTTQVVCIPLLLSEGETLVVMWVP